MTGTVSVGEWDCTALRRAADEVLDVYAEAMQVPRVHASSRRGILAGHLDRKGLRALGARDETGLLVGVAYGHLGAPGQWWHDQVRTALEGSLGCDAAQRWLTGAFEVCELHVRPAWQGTGLGRALLDGLLAGTPARVALLTTPDAETRARGFYRTAGWVDLARRVRFPGDPREFAVLGLRLARRPS
ncbi:MAG: GNAT family N-acetyltransferase [Actinomycetota bacterium]|nr:GNAT family N-acetyltransferase [Actinomycetota bacterium]